MPPYRVTSTRPCPGESADPRHTAHRQPLRIPPGDYYLYRARDGELLVATSDQDPYGMPEGDALNRVKASETATFYPPRNP